ncbi:MAG: AIPR family protein [Anaerolineales bacterium]
MANINDFKLLNIKCGTYFDLLEKSFNKSIKLRTPTNKERFGFYIFMLESICNVKDVSDITALITDTEFNSDVFDAKDDDQGVDAIFIDEENNYINLFNFKFREKFNVDKTQSVNETFLSTKFVQSIVAEDTSGLGGKLKSKSNEIIKKMNSNEIWRWRLYVVSNETIDLDIASPAIKQLREIYDLEIAPIGLDAISTFMSIRPNPVDAVIHIEKDSILPYSESNLSSSKSYVMKISANDLLRITCNNSEYRNNYGMEDFSVLFNTDMEYSLLFDNVRGLVVRSTFNNKVLDTLREDPTRFFMYNNGLTVTANDIEADNTNANKKMKITIKDFQVVNGGQTLRTLHKFNQQDKDNVTNYLSNCELLIRVFKTSTGSRVRNRIAEYTNSQNAISKIDLKSLSFEQIQIEQFLDEHDIIYARKTGDTGVIPSKTYVNKISMEKFGQILFSIQGHPEKASNQKKQIFDKYYDRIFGDQYFDLSKSAEYVNRYFEIKKEYDAFSDSDSTDQKIFYILYMDTRLSTGIKEKIELLESAIKSYRVNEDAQISDARKLLQVKFKEKLDSDIENYLKQ